MEVSSGVVERGEDFAVYERVVAVTDPTGTVRYQTNRFTLLENALHYFEDGQWKESQDVIEPLPDGAIARRGPHKAIFSPDLNAEAVFDLEASDGRRLRGGVRQIQLTDLALGKSVVLGTVKARAPGELLPPNRVVYRDAFDGVKADVVLVGRHNYFSHDVVLREQPQLPAELDPASTRLEVVTEFVEAPEPRRTEQVVNTGDGPELRDEVVVHFGRLAIVMGKAFPVTEAKAWLLGGLTPAGEGVPILKQWHALADGRRFLVESVGWAEAQEPWKDLPVPGRAQAAPRPEPARVLARTWPARPAGPAKREPILVAQGSYEPNGCVLDFTIIPDQGTPTTLATGQTYYIRTSYSSGSLVTFQPGCFIKFKQNAYMVLYGPLSFPTTGLLAVFTSRNDDLFGERIVGVPNESDSDGNPGSHRAAKALWIYYVNFSTTIQNARVRWAQEGIRYDSNPGVCPQHLVQKTRFEQSQTGIYLNFSSCGQNAVLNLANVKKCNVTVPVGGAGYYTGSMSDYCGVVNDPAMDSAAGEDSNKNSQSECAFVVVDNSRIVAAFFDTHYSVYGLGRKQFSGIVSPRSTGWAISTDGGATFADRGPLPPAPGAITNTWQGDAGDPVMVRDTGNGTIYLLTNPSREMATHRGFRLWKSTDNGQSFALIHTDVPPGVNEADKPMMTVDNSANSPNRHQLYVVGTGVINGQHRAFVTRSSNGGLNWDPPHAFHANGMGPDVAVAPDGTVYVFYLVNGPTVSLWYAWRRPMDTQWPSPKEVPVHTDSAEYYSVKSNASGNPKRSNSAVEEDHFVSNGFPRVAINPVNGRVYVVYADLPFAGSTTDRGDIYANEGIPNANGSLAWGAARRVNNDGTATDQWNPAVAVNQAGTQLFIGYYSRQEDTNNNALIKAYGAKANITGAWGSVTFNVSAISTTAFPPLFPGTTTSTPSCDTWRYDHVWAQAGVCLDENARVSECPPSLECTHPTVTTYQHFMADDYTWATADGSYFYFAWCDRWDYFGSGQQTRRDPNIRIAKISQ